MDLSARYSELVGWIGGGGAVSDTVLHIHGGMIILIAVRVATGRSLATPWPLLVVVVAAFAKELADYLAYDRIKPDSLSDIVNTVLWPFVLFVGLRIRRARHISSDKAARED